VYSKITSRALSFASFTPSTDCAATCPPAACGNVGCRQRVGHACPVLCRVFEETPREARINPPQPPPRIPPIKSIAPANCCSARVFVPFLRIRGRRSPALRPRRIRQPSRLHDPGTLTIGTLVFPAAAPSTHSFSTTFSCAASAVFAPDREPHLRPRKHASQTSATRYRCQTACPGKKDSRAHQLPRLEPNLSSRIRRAFVRVTICFSSLVATYSTRSYPPGESLLMVLPSSSFSGTASHRPFFAPKAASPPAAHLLLHRAVILRRATTSVNPKEHLVGPPVVRSSI